MRWASVATLGLLALLGSGCDDAKDIRTPTFVTNPEQFLFDRLPPGETAVRSVIITNEGRAELVLADITLDDDSSARELELTFRNPDGELGAVPDRLTIAPGEAESVELVVTYRPTDDSATADAGRVIFGTNDPDHLQVELPIVSGGQGAEINVSPTDLRFGAVEAGVLIAEEVTVSNSGSSDLVITRFKLSGGGEGEFGVREGERDLGGDLDPPRVLAPGSQMTIEVTYQPQTQGPDSGELIISSNDRVRPDAVVNLTANGAAPCIQVNPPDLDFGSGLIVDSLDAETPNRSPLSIESCGDTPLRVDRIEIVGGDSFKLLEPSMPFELPGATPMQDLPSQVVEVGFWPLESMAYGAEARIYSNGTPSDDPLVVPLFGRGVVNACPLPRTTAATYNVAPLDVVVLDGSPSADPGGEVVKYRWSVVSRPAGSTQIPVEDFADPRTPQDPEGVVPDDELTAQAKFFVDLAGRYEIDLVVEDNLGQESCPPEPAARVVIEAVPDKDLHVQLVWTTPSDPDETDSTGTDVDLHLRHELRGADHWGHSDNPLVNQYDCYFRNPQPDWGVAGDALDNPSLDIDDTNGAGPENINLSQPEPSVTYDVGAVYFRSESTFGLPDVDPRTEHVTLASVRIFVRGDLLFEKLDRELQARGEMWWMARVQWCEDFAQCPVIEDVDRILPESEWVGP